MARSVGANRTRKRRPKSPTFVLYARVPPLFCVQAHQNAWKLPVVRAHVKEHFAPRPLCLGPRWRNPSFQSITACPQKPVFLLFCLKGHSPNDLHVQTSLREAPPDRTHGASGQKFFPSAKSATERWGAAIFLGSPGCWSWRLQLCGRGLDRIQGAARRECSPRTTHAGSSSPNTRGRQAGRCCSSPNSDASGRTQPLISSR